MPLSSSISEPPPLNWEDIIFGRRKETPQSTHKPSNPKDAVGVSKVPLSTVPCLVLLEVGLAMLEGAQKYGRHNYRADGVRASVYFDALMRHMMAWWEGEDIDPDSALSHVTKAIASLIVLRDSMMNGNWTDDRPQRLSVPVGTLMAQMNESAAALVERYQNSITPCAEGTEDA